MFCVNLNFFLLEMSIHVHIIGLLKQIFISFYDCQELFHLSLNLEVQVKPSEVSSCKTTGFIKI